MPVLAGWVAALSVDRFIKPLRSWNSHSWILFCNRCLRRSDVHSPCLPRLLVCSHFINRRLHPGGISKAHPKESQQTRLFRTACSNAAPPALGFGRDSQQAGWGTALSWNKRKTPVCSVEPVGGLTTAGHPAGLISGARLFFSRCPQLEGEGSWQSRPPPDWSRPGAVEACGRLLSRLWVRVLWSHVRGLAVDPVCRRSLMLFLKPVFPPVTGPVHTDVCRQPQRAGSEAKCTNTDAGPPSTGCVA